MNVVVGNAPKLSVPSAKPLESVGLPLTIQALVNVSVAPMVPVVVPAASAELRKSKGIPREQRRWFFFITYP
uniref:Uncharacterized protein n=1 Tax=Yersinia ruckeri TaxID=29486 RepID=A0A0A8VD14_YERRU|nr:hypothetical protein CSF007_0345 [Yersinia ruckeri]